MNLPGWLSKVIRTVVFGNLWVSFGAVCMYWSTVVLHHLSFSPFLSASIFGATLFIYNYHRLFRKELIYKKQASARHDWILNNASLLRIFALLGMILAVAGFVPYLNSTLFFRFSPFILLALLYVIPVWKKGKKWLRLRDIPYLKIFLVSAVWAFVTVFLPFLAHDPFWTPTLPEWLTTFQRFIFIFAITLPFDIRDLEHDRSNQVKTIASYLGVDAVKTVSRILLALVAFSALICFQLGYYQPGNALGLLISCASTGWLISKANEEADEWYYAGLLDGTMVDQVGWILFVGLLL